MSAFDSTWLSTQVVYLQHYLVVAWLVPCETAAILVYVLCTPYNLVPVYIVTSCKTTCVGYVCLVVTCHLHCWQNDQDLLTWVWHRYQNKSQHRKLTLEKKILPPLMPGLKPRPFNESGAPPMSYHCCQGVLLCMRPYTKEPGWTIWTRLHMCWLPLPHILLCFFRKPVKNEGFESFFLLSLLCYIG